ncbi:hypothetical protein BDQ94DRAFT_138897 [Aspergillus welwitschiae]|uniref:Uncharacterized protein n=1 Tax=Aspergillus welwitschiae TaxID=1341132 RepID=A0A3F3QC25_9EURO|nr:hypothetical protein BDQ94DRAFT_138897 [Aspergillus welwitschiae]RDH36326.1 hypothetical protein BDQ94DRAFT_138897 [Aspergillus welwitschiae]
MQPWKPEMRASHPPPFSSWRNAFNNTSSFQFRLIGWGEINSQKGEDPGEAREVLIIHLPASVPSHGSAYSLC